LKYNIHTDELLTVIEFVKVGVICVCSRF